MASDRSNIEIVAREICARLYERHWPPGPEIQADIDRHWHIVAAKLEAGLMDETGADLVPWDWDREMTALRDWRSRHSDHVVPPHFSDRRSAVAASTGSPSASLNSRQQRSRSAR